MIGKASDNKIIASILHHLNNGIVQGILVLEKPSSQVVRDSGSIVDNSKVSIWVRSWVSLSKVFTLAKQVLMKFGSKCSISSFREKGLFLKNSQKTHWLLKHGDTFLQIHTKVNISPIETFPNIFLLLQGEHVLVEELLQFLIGKVDTNLFKAIVVK